MAIDRQQGVGGAALVGGAGAMVGGAAIARRAGIAGDVVRTLGAELSERESRYAFLRGEVARARALVAADASDAGAHELLGFARSELREARSQLRAGSRLLQAMAGERWHAAKGGLGVGLVLAGSVALVAGATSLLGGGDQLSFAG